MFPGLRPLLGLVLLAPLAVGADRPLDISVAPGDWGSASLPDIRAVVLSAAGELWRHCPDTTLDPIRIIRRENYPQTNFERDPEGRIVVGLHAKDRHWAQFAFQFAHEFGHVLAIHSQTREARSRDPRHPNMWLEESLCETASLFALRAMSRAWETNPPYPNWKSFAASLDAYVKERMNDPRHQLPEGATFAGWFKENEATLRGNPVLRDKNSIVASRLLPLFEAEPKGWEALAFLNLAPRDGEKPLLRHLADWRDAAPEKLRPFISKVAAVFGLSP